MHKTADVKGHLLASVQNKVAYWLDRLINKKKIGPGSLQKVFIKRHIPHLLRDLSSGTGRDSNGMPPGVLVN